MTRTARRAVAAGLGVALLVAAVVLAAGVGHLWAVWILGFVVFRVARGGRPRGAHWI